MMATVTGQARQFTGWHMLAVMVAFFAVIIGVNVMLAIYASSTWSGLVVENGYVASQQFGKELEKARTQKALGWQADVAHESGILRAQFVSKEGAALSGLTVQGLLRRPVTEREDMVLMLAEKTNGTYTAPLALKPGQWELEIEASDGEGHHFKETYRFVAEGSQ
jgi:nitrogen fixation protein FixH